MSGTLFIGVAVFTLTSAVLRRQRGTATGAFDLEPAWSFIYALALLLTGFGTTFYHASLTFVGQTADVLGMYLVVTAIALFFGSRAFRLKSSVAVLAYLSANIALLWLLIEQPNLRRYAFAILVLGTIGLNVALSKTKLIGGETKYFVAAVGALSVGFVIWIADIMHWLCAPLSWIQGHAMWHAAGAGTTWLMLVYMRSIRMQNETN